MTSTKQSLMAMEIDNSSDNLQQELSGEDGRYEVILQDVLHQTALANYGTDGSAISLKLLNEILTSAALVRVRKCSPPVYFRTFLGEREGENVVLTSLKMFQIDTKIILPHKRIPVRLRAVPFYVIGRHGRSHFVPAVSKGNRI